MMRNYTWLKIVLIFLLLLGASQTELFAQNYKTIGTGTNSTSSSSATPYSTLWEDGRHQYLYNSGALINNGVVAGMIWSLGFDVVNSSGFPLNGFTIKISSVPSGGFPLPAGWPANSTTVFVSPTPVVPTTGWNQYVFQTPFYYNGTDGIIVEVCFDNTSWGSSSSVRYSSQNNKTRGRYQDNASGCTLTGGFNSSYRPNIRLDNSPLYAEDAGVTALTNPTFPTCSMDSLVKVEVANMGTDTLTTVNVNWTINGAMQPALAWTGSLPQFGKDTATLGTVAGGLQDGDTIIAWTSSPNGAVDSASFNDTLVEVVYNAMAGTYSIDPAGGPSVDFISFNQALNIMKSYGICGPVIIEAVDSTYVEHLNIPKIDGSSKTNTITFTTKPGLSNRAHMQYWAGSSDNYVVNFDNSKNIIFDNISMKALGSSYCRVITTSGSTTRNITFNNCKLESASAASTSNNRAVAYLDNTDNHKWTFSNNRFVKGSYGIRHWGSSGNKADSNVYTNNTFINQRYRGADLYYHNEMTFTGNYIESATTYTSGTAFIFGYSTGGTYSNNHVKGNWPFPNKGMHFIELSGSFSDPVLIHNNRVFVPDGTSDVGIHIKDNLFTDVAFNSVYKSAYNYNQNRAMFIEGAGYVTVNNNNLQVRNSGTALFISGASVASCDYNNLSAPDTTCRVGNFNGTYYDSIYHWVAGTNFDSNSISIDSVYTDTANLRVCNEDLYQKGNWNLNVLTDYSGEPRASIPCIGADEFQSISQFGFNDLPICDNDSFVIAQYYYDTVVWNNSDTSNTHLIINSGSQQVAVYGLCGSDTSSFTVTPQEYANINDTNLCEGTSAVFHPNITASTKVEWGLNGINPSLSYTDSVTINESMTLWVYAEDVNGCYSSDTAIITSSTNVSLPAEGKFCEGSNLVLDANMQGAYTWSDNSANQTLNVSTPGTYSVTVVDQNCTSSDTIVVFEVLNPISKFTDSSSVFTVAFTNKSENATNYHWDFGDGDTSILENPIHIYPWTNMDSLNVNVILTATNECGSETFQEEVRYGQMVNVTEINANHEVVVYPNPNEGNFFIDLKTNSTQEVRIEVISLTGAVIYRSGIQQQNGSKSHNIDLSKSSPGIYLLNIHVGNQISTHKVVKR